MAEIYDLDVSAANNNSAPPNGFPENMQYSQVNDSAREQMALLARFVQALSGVQTAGTSNAYTLAVSQTLSAYAEGQLFVFEADRANTGAATLNVNGLGAKAIVNNRGTALVADDIVLAGRYLVQYDGTSFMLLGQGNTFTSAEKTKLAGIETGATGDMTGAEIKALYEAEANTNAFTDANVTKLAGIESGATADQTNAEIRAAVEAATDSNVFTDADHSKLNNLSEPVTGSVSAAFLGFSSAINRTINYRVVDGIATLYVTADRSGTSNSSAFDISGLPVAVRPAATRYCTGPALSSVYSHKGMYAVNSDGTVDCYFDDNGLGWTSVGTKGLPGGWTISYPL